MRYYVDCSAKRPGMGDAAHPFQTIQAAAEIAMPGDEVLVAPGIYREYVNPKHAGTKEKPIVYRSEKRRGAVITGAELLTGWQQAEGHPGVYTVRVKNSVFGAYNPYTTRVSGDWFVGTIIAHTGDVYLNHQSMYEVTEKEKVFSPVRSAASWDPDFSVFVWYAEQDKERDETVFFANFHEVDPNNACVECSVRRNCFLPDQTGISDITLEGFVIREAATQWAPPTAYQDGMVGPHWSKGWVIKDCEIAESKCSGISLGKVLQPENDNKWLKEKTKDGTQTERDCILKASYEGWDKEHVGSHHILLCDIHDCGQTGIVGHLGGVFSVIEDNRIFRINVKKNLAGAEIGGIKMHAAIDCIFRRNVIHHCTRGIWLDWQAQGTRVTQNLFFENTWPKDVPMPGGENAAVLFRGLGEDLFVEVSHGPTLVDNNLFLSARSVKFASQGGAFVHNLFAGSLTCIGTGTDNGAVGIPSQRYTPYHEKHGTRVAGFMTILHGDVRFYSNVFVQTKIPEIFHQMQVCVATAEDPRARMWDTMNFDAGTFVYNGYPTEEEWKKQFEGYCGMGAESGYPNRYYTHLPVWACGNVYFGGAKPWENEKDPVVVTRAPRLALTEQNGRYVLDTDLYEEVERVSVGTISTETLGQAFEPEERFENPDGSDIVFDADCVGAHRGLWTIPGPFAGKEEAEEPLF